MGSAAILRRHLKLDPNFPIPLSLGHGIDVNQCPWALDVHSIEPLHWSCSPEVHERASSIKPSVRLPHPWAIVSTQEGASPYRARPVLVVGPPPSATNDERLLQALRQQGIYNYDLLVKQRGDIAMTFQFWRNKGITPVTAGPSDEGFYSRLHGILRNYDLVIGGTLSTALFFAASIGKPCKLLQGYTYRAYDVADYLNTVDFGSLLMKRFTRHLIENRTDEAARLARQALGFEYLEKVSQGQEELTRSIELLRRPFHHSSGSGPITRWLAEAVAVKTGKTGLLGSRPAALFSKKLGPKVGIMSIDEVDVWLNGLCPQNFRLDVVPYVKGVTEPGWAAD